MGKTVIEKIVEHNTGRSVKPGDIVTVNVDRVMIHDIFIPFVAEKFKEMGFEKLWPSFSPISPYFSKVTPPSPVTRPNQNPPSRDSRTAHKTSP